MIHDGAAVAGWEYWFVEECRTEDDPGRGANIWHCEGRIGFEALSIRVSHLAVWSSYSHVPFLPIDEGGSAVGVRIGRIRP